MPLFSLLPGFWQIARISFSLPVMDAKYPYYLANKPVFANSDLEVTDKFTGKLAARVAQADEKAILAAIEAAVAAQEPLRKMPAFERKEVLLHCVARFTEMKEELALALCVEAGKPIKDSRVEVMRLIETFQIAAEESVRFGGETLPLDISARARGYQGFTKRVPIGPCSFISPFNFPLNLAAHKIAPAIAVGCPFVLKPASLTPIGSLLIGKVLAETKLPAGAFSILPCHREGAELFTTDDRFKLLSFTGSPDVGWALKAKAGKKKVVLELGGNAGCIVEPDADLQDAVARNVTGAFYQSGQSCISVQRIFVHEKIYSEFKNLFCAKVQKLEMGDPRKETTFIGPMISEKEAERVEDWIAQAKREGAVELVGGVRTGLMVPATVLENVPHSAKISKEEAFGPVVLLEKYSVFEDALKQINASRYGLQAGIFTRDLYKALRAWDVLEVGGVLVGEVPSWRVDSMPYGGVKDSGLGREGIRYAMEDMTEPRLLIIRTP
jgi:acyl-CoA reductase-like NAD-dependent aldehyde dehydrogenase